MSNNVWQQYSQWYQRCQWILRICHGKRQKIENNITVLRSAIGSLEKRSICIIIAGVSLVFWLYYELHYVAPVCPYYTGSTLPTLLNRFKTIGKTYRPTFYMFAPYCQWIYLICFTRLMLLYHWLQCGATESRYKFVSQIHKLALYLMRLLFRTFLFRKMFRNQPSVAIRELVEAHNDAVVVLDYYLPKWVGEYCKQCGKFKQDSPKCEESQKNNRQIYNHYVAEDGKDPAACLPKAFNDSNIHEIQQGTSLLHTRNTKGHIPGGENREIIAEINSGLQGNSGHLMTKDDFLEDNMNLRHLQNPAAALPLENPDSPPRKILRGVLVVICDVGVSYSICDQPIACRCGKNVDHNIESMCKGCVKTTLNDSRGLNIGPPMSPTVRYLIGDALEVGYACVQIHLNVNLGMASEAFPSWTGLRCFPISLYSDVILDLDAALIKISERYPNLPLNCVGFGYGANILMEYIAMGSSGKPIAVNNDANRSSRKGYGHPSEWSSLHQRQSTFTESFQSNETRSEGESPVTNGNETTPKHCVALGYGSITKDNNGSYTKMQHSSNTNANRRSLMDNSAVPVSRSDPNYESFCHLSEMMGKVASARSSNDIIDHGEIRNGNLIKPKEGYFIFKEEAEECTYETRMAYPPPQPSEVILNTKRISAAVCVNLNLRPGGNPLYNHAGQRKMHRKSFYSRYCFASFRRHLTNLLREVHCRRANDGMQKECHLYRCCHFTKEAKKKHWLKSLLLRLRDFNEGFEKVTRYYSIEQMLLQIHQEYKNSYRYMKRKASVGHVNYGSGIYKRFGARAASDFKFAALMTLRYVYTHLGQDSKNHVETLSSPPIYKPVNRRVKTRLSIGRGKFHSGTSNLPNHSNRRHQDPNIYRYIADLINREYNNNVANIRKNFTSIELHTLLINSLDNSLCSLEDIDVLDVIRNPNIVYYIAKSGGYSTFLSGTYPAFGLSAPILEFIDEITSRRVVL